MPVVCRTGQRDSPGSNYDAARVSLREPRSDFSLASSSFLFALSAGRRSRSQASDRSKPDTVVSYNLVHKHRWDTCCATCTTLRFIDNKFARMRSETRPLIARNRDNSKMRSHRDFIRAFNRTIETLETLEFCSTNLLECAIDAINFILIINRSI